MGMQLIRLSRRADSLALCPGDWVEVRSESEILATLDVDGTLDALPFMPEMRRYCGRRFRVRARADRTSMAKLSLRAMEHAVHLDDVRCDGGSHDGCARGCTIFWKEAWLVRAGREDPLAESTSRKPAALHVKAGDLYICQATELGRATRRLSPKDVRRHVAALTGEGLSVLELARAAAILVHDRVMWRLQRPDWNTIPGPCVVTPSTSLGLQPGERVRVKSKAEIVATLDRRGWNHRMEFSREMLRFCGKEFTVLRRVDRFYRRRRRPHARDEGHG